MSQGTVRGNRKPRVQNAASLVLDNSENESLFNILGRGCVTLATGVVQLYTADPPARQRWSKRHTGVVCFIKDNPQRSYFIRVYDIKKACLIWEQEIYNQFRYKSPRDYFHTFEAEDVQAGLNFASEDEAFKFKKAVEEKLLERHQRRMEKKKQSVRVNPNRPQPPPSPNAPKAINSGPPPSSSEVSLNKPATNQSGGTLSKAKTKKDKGGKAKKLTKEDISTPTDFRHVSHVGWDPNKGFDMNSLDPSMKEVFKSVGIDENDAIDEETVDFIYQFVDSHGGLDAIKAEMATRPPPAAPAGNPRSQGSRPPPPPTRQGMPPPPPPQQKNTAPPPPPPNRTGPRSLGAPPPPPPASHGFPPPPPPSTNKPMPPAPPPPSSAVPTPPPSFSKPAPPGPGGPPPPPPPPPPSAPAPPPPPPVGGPAVPTPPADSGGRGALLDQIRGGMSLKNVTVGEKPASSGDARGDLLSAIRTGTNLKHVGQQAAEEKPASTETQGGIVGALARALANRQKHIQGSDDESDDDDDEVSDDDDWDD